MYYQIMGWLLLLTLIMSGAAGFEWLLKQGQRRSRQIRLANWETGERK